MAALVEAKSVLSSATASVFFKGKYSVQHLKVETSSPSSSPPKPLFIVFPTDKGTFPVLLFLHGFNLYNTFYTELLKHIASHGFIIVAPQLYVVKPPGGYKETNSAAAVTNWLSRGLQSVLPSHVEANLNELALAGHSRGGKTAFSLALGYASTSLDFSVLLGIDPVAGNPITGEGEPEIIGEPFELGIPVMVLGTGLGGESKVCCCPPFAPEGYNYKAFFKDCQPPCACFVASDYGHMDMLDDDSPGLVGTFSNLACVNGKGDRDPMRRTVGGTVVACLKAYLHHESSDLKEIVADPDVAPVKLDPVIFKKESNQVLV